MSPRRPRQLSPRIGRFGAALVRPAAWMCATLLAAGAASATTSPDYPSAIVVYPYVTVDPASGIDTQIQLTNATDEQVGAQCFYERIQPDCVGGGEGESCSPSNFTCTGTCVTQPQRIEFSFRITAGQPLAWFASEGLGSLPLDGIGRTGPGGQSNGSSSIPPLGPGGTTASLRCVVVGAQSMLPAASDALVGLATVRTRGLFPSAVADAAQYRAIGIRSLDEDLSSEISLRLGGPLADFEACSTYEYLEHYFSGAPLRVGDETSIVDTTLVLLSCSTAPNLIFNSVAQFLVYNEFGQHFSTSRPVAGYFVSPLALIDTGQPERSIFAIGVAGTLAGRTQIAPVGNGLHALAIETHRNPSTEVVHSDAFELQDLGNRVDGDVIVLSPPPCPGDCDDSGVVSVSEVITGVGIGMGQIPLERCERIDTNGDESVAIDEMVASVGSSILSCPSDEPSPALTPTPTATPVNTRSGLEPEITHFGLAAADDEPLTPDDTDDEGRPVYVRPFGQGFTLIVEGRPGLSGSPLAGNTYSEIGAAPDLQLISSNPLGDGDPTVCEQDGVSGGVPAVPDLEFALSIPATLDAINDLGCRAFDRMATTSSTCTRRDTTRGSNSPFATVKAESTLQFCIPIARAWALPKGDTVFAARVRAKDGLVSAVQQIVVRVQDE